MIRHTHTELVYYTFESIPVKHGIFTRLGGVSEGMWASLNLSPSTGDNREHVRANRERMKCALGIERWITSWLVHGSAVRVLAVQDLTPADGSDPDLVHADGMVTADEQMALTLRFADCVPVLLYDVRRHVAAIAHAGWKGIVNGVLEETVRAMSTACGSNPADICAGVGPCIGPDKFEVGADVAAQIQRAVSERVVIERPGVRPHVDLWRAARAQLHGAGVGTIEVAGICTASNTREWFSHRAERGQTGRFGAVIQLS